MEKKKQTKRKCFCNGDKRFTPICYECSGKKGIYKWLNEWADFNKYKDKAIKDNKFTEFGQGYQQAVMDICDRLEIAKILIEDNKIIKPTKLEKHLKKLRKLRKDRNSTKLNDGNDGIPPKPKDLGILPTIT